MDKDITEWVATCSHCQETPPAPPWAPVREWKAAKRLWLHIHIDFLGPVEGQMFQIIVDAYSKWLEVLIMQSTMAEATGGGNHHGPKGNKQWKCETKTFQEQTRGEEETQLLNAEAEHWEKITAHIQWKRHLEVMKAKVLEQVHSQLSDLLDKALEEEAHQTQQLSVIPAKKQSREKGQLLKKKVFVPQRSLFDTLLEVEYFRTIHHIFVAVLCIFVLKQITVDSIDEGRLVLDFELFIIGFRQLPTALLAWLCMFLYTLFVPYQALQIWSGCLKMTRFPNLLTATLVFLVLLCHAAVLGFFPVYIAVYCNLGIAARKIVLFEQIRFLMKSYSFLRESMPPLLHARNQVGKISCPEFSTYLYFLFCPTLIYRMSYPRDPYIRWSYVIRKLVEPFTIKTLLLSIFDSVIPGISFLFVVFYFFQDCWQNIFAEILRFADRSFYKDWWNSTSFSAYFRSWNGIVHDWLYCYLSRFSLIGGRARTGAMFMVFLLSAVIHEYLFTLAFGFFFPVMFVLFAMTGVFFNFVLNDKRKGPFWNIIIWICLCLGLAIILSSYCQEWFAQAHCPLKEKTFWGQVTPRSWSCHA
ncbi:LOW QUALITY PROTEIN: sterol O-acyltransferase 2-like [Thamnophis elegans]|uniref:LOW QUALITY PROTEIN: sterol O-acyltransferase 2-like n=1 Tax=Thamnophis elegans TaxID=35005 RepID=UPI001378C353|nr:LOW QUALITY PROTEIN: sterol O-acyltransferase 2-like [Thamnophis elegans]